MNNLNLPELTSYIESTIWPRFHQKNLVRDDGQWWLTSDNQDQRRYPRVKCNGETEIIGEVVYLQTAVI